MYESRLSRLGSSEYENRCAEPFQLVPHLCFFPSSSAVYYADAWVLLPNDIFTDADVQATRIYRQLAHFPKAIPCSRFHVSRRSSTPTDLNPSPYLLESLVDAEILLVKSYSASTRSLCHPELLETSPFPCVQSATQQLKDGLRRDHDQKSTSRAKPVHPNRPSPVILNSRLPESAHVPSMIGL